MASGIRTEFNQAAPSTTPVVQPVAIKTIPPIKPQVC